MSYAARIPFPKVLRGLSLTPAQRPAPIPAFRAPEPAPAPPAIPTVVPLPNVMRGQASKAEPDEHGHELRGLLTQICDAATDLHKQQRQRLTEMQTVAVELAMAIASHLVHQHLQTGEFAVEALVHKVVQRLQPTEAVKVFLNPEDWALLHQRQETKPLQSGGPSLQLLADPALQRGDCRAESGDVGLLWQLEDQLSEIRRHLLRSLSEAEVDRRGAVVGGTMLKRFPERRQTA